MQQEPLAWRRVRIVYTMIFVLAALLAALCTKWDVVDAAYFRSIAESRVRDGILKALRGTIYAADGTTLAYSERRYNVFIYTRELFFAEEKMLQTRREFTSKLAPIIDTTVENLERKIIENREKGVEWIKVASNITSEQHDKIQNLRRDRDAALKPEKQGRLQGFGFEHTSKRIYPEARLASQVIGLTNPNEKGDMIGLGGLEGGWDGHLEPVEGFVQGETDALGNAIGIASSMTIEAERGSNIYTTIDKYLQKVTQDKLKWAVEKYQADSGSVIIMDPKTGAILALANYPDYDPNVREETDGNVYGNQAVSEPYEAGSVGKIITLAAAIDSDTVTPDTVVIEGHKGCEKIHQDLEPVCTHDKQPQPPLPIKEAFALSDNIYFLHLAEKIEKEKPTMFYQYLTNFGVNRASGIDLQGESIGVPLTDPKLWNIGDIAAYSYGHSYQVNLVQIADYVSAIANKGVRMQPYVVSKIVEGDGNVVEFKPQALARVVTESTTNQMDIMMNAIYKRNIYGWEGYYNGLRNAPIAMKSGTALIQRNGRYTNDINATYVGYDFSPERRFVMVSRLENPRQGDLAGQNARLLWLETFKEIKGYLGM